MCWWFVCGVCIAGTGDAAKLAKPAVITFAPRGSCVSHKLKLKLSGHMVRCCCVVILAIVCQCNLHGVAAPIFWTAQDGVRALAFHPTEPLLVSGSEDCTVKVWKLSNVGNGPPLQRATEVDSLVTMRVHTQSVLALAVFSAETYPDCSPGQIGAFASAGRDGTLNLFQLQSTDTEKPEPYTYAEYESMKIHSIKKAHDDAIWDLHAHPLSNTLFSAGADGVVRTWGVASGNSLSMLERRWK